MFRRRMMSNAAADFYIFWFLPDKMLSNTINKHYLFTPHALPCGNISNNQQSCLLLGLKGKPVCRHLQSLDFVLPCRGRVRSYQTEISRFFESQNLHGSKIHCWRFGALCQQLHRLPFCFMMMLFDDCAAWTRPRQNKTFRAVSSSASILHVRVQPETWPRHVYRPFTEQTHLLTTQPAHRIDDVASELAASTLSSSIVSPVCVDLGPLEVQWIRDVNGSIVVSCFYLSFAYSHRCSGKCQTTSRTAQHWPRMISRCRRSSNFGPFLCSPSPASPSVPPPSRPSCVYVSLRSQSDSASPSSAARNMGGRAV